MASEKSKVSIVIPTFNASCYLTEAINSALVQTYKNTEVVVVDDGSTDNTKQILKPFIDQHLINYLYQENKGPASARNLGIKESHGEFIAFLDADDIWFSVKLEKQIRLFESHNVGIVYSDRLEFSEDGQLHQANLSLCRGNILKQLFRNNFITNSSVIVRRSVFDEVGMFNESKELFALEDYEMWLRIAVRFGVDYVEDPLVRYRLHPGQISRLAVMKVLQSQIQLYRNMYHDKAYAKFKRELYLQRIIMLKRYYFIKFQKSLGLYK